MFRKITRLALTVSVCVALLALAGCDAATGPTGDSLVGVWSSSGGDGFTVTNKMFIYFSWDGGIGYYGDIVNDPDLTAESGYMVVRITYRVNSWDPEVGKYFTIHWKTFSGDGVREAGAYKTGSAYNSGMDTLAEAEVEYTVANGYFGLYGEYLREE